MQIPYILPIYVVLLSYCITLQIIIFTEAGVDKSGGDAQIPAKLPAESAKPHT